MFKKNILCYTLLMLIGFFYAPVQDAIGSTVSFSLSKTKVVKNHSFGNTFITAAGEVGNADGIVINVLGPKARYVIWQKEKRFGIWNKSKGFLSQNTPSYQCIMTNYDSKVFDNFMAKVENLSRFSYPQIINNNEYSKEEIEKASNAYLDIKKEKNLLIIKTSAIPIVNSKFTVDIPIPANIEDGRYKVKIYILKNFKIISRRTSYFSVSTDIRYERLKYLAQQYPLLYAILSIVIALTVGAIANFVFGRAKNIR